MKIAACVILYQPGNPVEENIKSYIDKVDKVFIVDNTDTGNTPIQFSGFPSSKSTLIRDGNNEGIANRLNQVCDLALEEGFEYLLTMDQDSFFEEIAITDYFKCIYAYPARPQVSMFGISYEKKSSTSDCNCKKVKHLITSGSVINLSVYKITGGFDKNLFIDFVDTEYCFNSILKGFDIIKYQNIFMHHNLGESIEKRSLITLKKTNRSFHSELRLYYMMRNFLYIKKRYKKNFEEQITIYKTDLMHRIKNKLLYAPNRLKTLQYLFKAYKDYRNNKMGKQL